jgi:hypothetical protein
MAGGAGAGPAAIGINAWDIVLDGRFHHGKAGLGIDNMFFAAVLNKSNLRHKLPRIAAALSRNVLH